MASRSHCSNQWNRTEESREYEAGETDDVRKDDSPRVISVSFGFGAAVLMRDFILVEQLGHFLGHHVSIVWN